MKFTRTASTNWKGTGMEGKGSVTTQSTVLNNTQLSFKTRFADGIGTNPEELIAAAHSGCFTMQLSFLITEKGFTPEDLTTEAQVTFEDGTVTKIHLKLEANVPGMTEQDFQETAAKAKEICPVSKVLNAEKTLSATLVG